MSCGAVGSCLATDGKPPGWFVRYELGFSFGSDANLALTLTTLHETNRKRLAILAEREGKTLRPRPKRQQLTGKARRTNAKERRRNLLQVARRAGLLIGDIRRELAETEQAAVSVDDRG